MPYLTIPKATNLLLNIVEMKNRSADTRSLPPYIKIEPSPVCQLKCPACKSSKVNSLLAKQFPDSVYLTLDNFKKILDPLSHTLLGISMSYDGEPLLASNIISLIEYAHSKNVAVHFPSNMSVELDINKIDGIVKSGLDSILISLDGASEETYKQYRVGGQFHTILKNVKALSEAKQKFGLRRPRLIWKFIIFKHNQHEVPLVQKIYSSLGFDDYEIVLDVKNKNRKKLMHNGLDYTATKKSCFWLWHTMVICWNGDIQPCCIRKHDNIGNAIAQNSDGIWHGEIYRALREGFSKRGYGEKMNIVCSKCMGISNSE